MRFFLPALAAAFVVAPAFAQPKVEYKTVPITLHPTAPPVPLGTIRLAPGYEDITPGNRVQGLLKTFMEQDNFFKIVGNEEWHNELEMPLAEFKEKSKYRTMVASGIAYDTKFTKMMGYLDKGARYKQIEWNEYDDLRKDGFYLLLPEVQKLRQLASALHMRLRNEIIEGQFARAVITIQTLVGMAQALEQHPCLVANLVGLAILNIAASGLEEMIGQPGCPNLYWALTDLRSPLVDLRIALGGEKLFVVSQFKSYLTTTRVLTDKEIEAFLAEVNELMKFEGNNAPVDKLARDARIRFGLIAADLKRIEQARKRIIASGADAAIMKAMPNVQIAILDEFFRYEVLRDEFFKVFHLPFPVAKPFMKETEQALIQAKQKGDIIGPAFLPALWKTKEAQARLELRLASLRVIEAIRLYAHKNGGQLPASLAATGVPIPLDPFTGEPFGYELPDGQAIVRTGNTGLGRTHNREYVLTIAK
jgi:hypothetical protein